MTGSHRRLALLGDVHGNAAALRGVLEAVDALGITAGASTGDLVMRGMEPEACIALLRRRGWPSTMGNTDLKVATRAARRPDDPKARRVGSRSWTTNRLDAEDLAWLAARPMISRVDLSGRRVVVMHGGPEDPRDAVDEATPDGELAALAASIEADVVVMGHIHRQMVRRAGGALFINPGSVGEAVDGDRRPRWAWLEAGPHGLAVHLEVVEREL
ncbi:MAG: metallophosphoesterase family protein, partial [Miltoncostaeaceae bacterium]